jgi:hypothetical protein
MCSALKKRVDNYPVILLNSPMMASNVTWHQGDVSRHERQQLLGQTVRRNKRHALCAGIDDLVHGAIGLGKIHARFSPRT